MRKHYWLGRPQQGVTFPELLISVAIIALIMAIGIPSFSEVSERKKLEGAAEKVYADLQHAKTEAIKRNRIVYVNFDTANQCYGVALTTGCACNTALSCVLDSGVDTAVRMSDYGQTRLEQNFNTEVAFDPRRGTATKNGTVTLISPRGKEVQVVMGNLFRIKICSPSGAKKDFNYADCP